jgi:SOS-response transcriptional repressor LexA
MIEFQAMPTQGVFHYSTTEAVYLYLRDYIQREGFAPSLREISAGCDLSVSTVVYHLNRLQEWGFIARASNRARTILLLDEEPEPAREAQLKTQVAQAQGRGGRHQRRYVRRREAMVS